MNKEWQMPEIHIRQDWAKADVALLPKGKPNASSPLDWRPIGLQHPLGKAIMKTLMKGAKEQIAAYLPGRSTTTALKTVFSHCDHVRSGCASTRLTIHEKHEGQPHSEFYGGLQVSLDLTAAFDLVGWGHVQEALSRRECSLSPAKLSCSGYVRSCMSSTTEETVVMYVPTGDCGRDAQPHRYYGVFLLLSFARRSTKECKLHGQLLMRCCLRTTHIYAGASTRLRGLSRPSLS